MGLDHDFRLPRYLLRIVAGAAQSSIGAPHLWYTSCDSLPRMEMPEELCLVGYDDDVAALVAACTIIQAQIKFNRVNQAEEDFLW